MAGRQADLADKQQGFERKRLIIENRPRLRVRSIAIAPPLGDGGALFVKGHVVKGSLVVVNNGGTDAKNVESGYRIFWSVDGLPMRPPIDEKFIKLLLVPGQTIEGFSSCLIPIESAIPLDCHSDNILLEGGGYQMFVTGFICYSDWDSKERYMGFCRQYAPTHQGEGRFLPVPNSDYEYED